MDAASLLRLVKRDYVINGRRSTGNLRYQEKHLLRHFGGRDVAELTTGDVEEYKSVRLAEGAAPATVNNELALLRRAFTLAKRQEILEKAPTVVTLRVSNAREGFVKPGEFERLRRTLEVLDPAVADAVTWLYHLGWRRNEVLGLTWADVDLEDGTVALPASRSKNGSARRVRLPQLLHDILRARWAARRGEFVFQRWGKRIRHFRGVWRRATAALGRPELIPHDLRRSFARNATQAGVPQKTIMELGGWKTAAVFFRYAIVDEGQLGDALERTSKYANGT